MKKLIISVLVCTLVFGMVGMAEAAMVTYTESLLGSTSDSSKFVIGGATGGNQTAYFNFDLTQAGNTTTNYAQLTNTGTKILPLSTDDVNVPQFNSTNYTINSVTLNYTLSDTDNSSDKFTVVTGSSDGSITIAPQVNQNVVGTGQSKSFSYVFSTSDLTYLNDGKLQFTIATGGSTNITVEQAQLVLTATPVPIPAAGLLLGSGLIGLIAIRRKQTA